MPRHRAIDVVLETSVVSSSFFGEQLGVSVCRTETLIGQLQEVGILSAATGKYPEVTPLPGQRDRDAARLRR